MTTEKKKGLQGILAERNAPPTKPPTLREQGKTKIIFTVSEAAKYQLDLMAVETRRTKQDLLTAGLNLMFEQNGKKPIA